MRVSTAAHASPLMAQESMNPQQLTLLFSEGYLPPKPLPTTPANDASKPKTHKRSPSHLQIVSPPFSQPKIDVNLISFVPEHSGKWLDAWLKKEKNRGLPERVAYLWRSLVPWLVELSYFSINPAMTLAANVKQVRRIYNETKKLRIHASHALPDLVFDSNIMECVSVALGTLPHAQSEGLVDALVFSQPSSFSLTTGAVARNEALHSLDVILTSVWNKRHRHGLTTHQLIEHVAGIMSYMYWEAGRSPLLNSVALTQTDMGRLERRERELYYSIFTDSNIDSFLEHLEKNILILHQIRQHVTKRFIRFLIRDPRWSEPFNQQLAQIEAKYRDYLDFS